jgi:hypothetical protein
MQRIIKKFVSSSLKKCKNFKNKLKGKKRKIILFFLLTWSLKVNPVQGQGWPNAEGFGTNPINRSFKNWFSKTPQNSNNRNALFDRVLNIRNHEVIMEDKQVQIKFKHAKVFGVTRNLCRDSIEEYKNRMIDHMKDPSTIIKDGTFKKTIEVTHYFNQDTSLNVMVRKDDNTFISGWKLSKDQLENLKNRGAL